MHIVRSVFVDAFMQVARPTADLVTEIAESGRVKEGVRMECTAWAGTKTVNGTLNVLEIFRFNMLTVLQ